MKKIISMVLVVVMLLTILPILSTPAYAAPESTNIRAKLNLIVTNLNENLKTPNVFSADGTICYTRNQRHTCDNCSLYGILPVLGEDKKVWEGLSSNGWSCSAFAKYIFVKTFGSCKDTTDFDVGPSNELSTYNKLRTGDLIYSKKSEGKAPVSHWMIFLSADENGIDVLEANGSGKLDIRWHRYLFSDKSSNLSNYIFVWQSPRWNEVNGTNVATQPIPKVPTGLTACKSSSTTTNVSWNFSSGASYYELEYKSPNTKNAWVKDTDYKNSYATSYTATRMGNNTTYYFRVRAVNSAGKSDWSKEVMYIHQGTPTPPPPPPAVAITVNASANRNSGTTNDKYSYTVTTNVAATKVTYSFDGSATLYALNSNGSSNFNAGTGNVSSDKKTWIWSGDKLRAGNRTIKITAYDVNGKSASTSLYINVSAPAAAVTPPPPPPAVAIAVNASANRYSGTTKDSYSYTVTTNVAATKVTYSFDGNTTLYILNGDGSHNFNAGISSISSDKKTWVWSGDKMRAGNRTIKITAYDANGNSASTYLNINVTR